MADAPPPAAPATQHPHGGKKGVSHAGDTVGHVSNGLKALTCGHRNPVSEIVGTVADGLKSGAGEPSNRHQLSSNHGKKP